ncbi:MAG: ABC transporter permease [Candidatus Pristimantibacillus lignocellulolyticus]|uniref:ABC transporter permease n=1 Tax=Candidatus Pristimantibacillus lignocellulolyticus TaxID=2994561 RepID=A0A9J6ZM07_9BACL|nr:MAG: ABC transporter permease [Candidatus Pristimantibacillus lignocellulolyticus]
MDLIGNLLNGTLVFSTALIFAALGGLISERSGVINIGLEGFMISGAFFSAITAYYAESAGLSSLSPWIGLIGAFVFTIIFSSIHAIASIKFKANQVVSGVVINILAASSTFFLVKMIFNGSAETPILVNVFHKIRIPYLSDIPLIGKVFFNAYPTTYIAIALVILLYFILFRTSTGLRLRAVGEHPSAADTVGIKVNRTRYIAVILSGSIAAIGGATIVLTSNSNFAFNTISGQGYIALAAVIFGKWNPVGAMLAAMFFGLAQAVKDQLQIFEFAAKIPNEFFYMLPYLLTLLVLIGAVGKARSPKALGEPYEVGKR